MLLRRVRKVLIGNGFTAHGLHYYENYEKRLDANTLITVWVETDRETVKKFYLPRWFILLTSSVRRVRISSVTNRKPDICKKLARLFHWSVVTREAEVSTDSTLCPYTWTLET